MLSVFFLTSLFALRIYGVQADLDVTFDDFVVTCIDPEYFNLNHSEFYLETNDAGLNELFVQIEIIKLFDIETTTAHGYLRELSMGRYNKPTGIDVTGGLCDLNEPVIMAPILLIMGFQTDKCPPELGVYGTERYLIPNDIFPETFGENKYLFALEVFVSNKTIFSINAFVDITEYDR